MIETGIPFERAFDIVKYYHTENGKGKKPIDNMNTGFTTYANCLKIVKYASGCTDSVPTRAAKAKRLLVEIGVLEESKDVVLKGVAMRKINETLFGEPKGGAVKQWSVYVDGCTVVVEWGRVGGKLQTKETVCTGKNIGRANETTPEEQATLEAISKYKKQLDKYYRPTVDEVMELETEGVMLAQDYTKKPHFLSEKFYVSPKLDGLRVKTVFDSEGNPVWESRGGQDA